MAVKLHRSPESEDHREAIPRAPIDDRARWLLDHSHRIAAHRKSLEAVLRELQRDESAAHQELADLLGIDDKRSPPAEVEPTIGSEADPDLSIWLLGGFKLIVGGVVVIGCGADRSSQVLRFIAACGSPGVHKERLANQFWPDADAKTARRNLHQAIYSVRRLLSRHGAESELTLSNDHYALGTDDGRWRDVDELVRWVDRGRVAQRAGDEAAAIHAFRRADLAYGGEFLADHPYDDWALAPRERYRTVHREASAAILAHSEASGDHCAVLQVASRLLALNPCDEDACRYVMRAHAESGQPHLSTMAFNTLSEQLQHIYEADPSPETLDLLEVLKRK